MDKMSHSAFIPATSIPLRAHTRPRALSRRAGTYSVPRQVRMCEARTPTPTPASAAPEQPPAVADGPQPHPVVAWYRAFAAKRGALKAQTLRRYGVAAMLSYGMFDAVTYSISFLLSLRAYLAAGKVLTWQTFPQVLALMWGINNLSRPFRIAGAIALAPIVDRRVVKPVSKFITRLRTPKDSS